MDLSYFIQPVHPLDRNYREILLEDVESVILADKIGFKEAFIGEHFTDLAEPITSCLMFISHLASLTKSGASHILCLFKFFVKLYMWVRQLEKERNRRQGLSKENMRQFSNWLHAVADKNGQLVLGMLLT